jgi:hypothetical protein
LDIFERARRYVAKMPPAISGQAGHNSTFAVAVALIKGFDLTIDQARPILAEYNQGCLPQWSTAELEHKLTSAAGTADDRARGWLLEEKSDGKKSHAPPQDIPSRVPKAKFENQKLKSFAARWRPHISTAWLADRSVIDPFRLSAGDFLSALYSPSEYVLVFTNQKSQGDAVWPRDKLPASSPDGVWFLIQPVDGKVYPNPRSLDKEGNPKPSRRSEESVTSWRFLVLESDEADPRDWLAAIAQLFLPIAAIYTSGKRSIHALIRLDAASISEWRDFSSSVIKPILVKLGADVQVVASSVRLSRLPGCLRGPHLQKLLYLNPAPEVKPICALPRLRDVVNHWTDAAFNHLPYCAADIIERHLKNKGGGEGTFQDCIAGLDQYSAPNFFSAQRADCLFALEWFSTSPAARELLGKLRASAPDEFNQ